MEFGNALPHDIKISGSHNKGFIVKAGCCTAVFTEKEALLKAIGEYIDDPEGMEKAYNKSNVNRTQEVATEETAPDPGRTERLRSIRETSPGENCDQSEEAPTTDRRR